MAKKFTQDEVMTEVTKLNLNFDTNHFIEPDNEKRGRKKGAKKTEVQPVFGDDDDEEVPWGEMMDMARDNVSENSEKSKATSKTSKKSKEEKEAEKKQKVMQKMENDEMKQEDKLAKAVQKKEEKAAKAAAKAAEKAEKEAAKAAKKAAKNTDADDKRSPVRDIQEEKMGEEVVEYVEEVPPSPPLEDALIPQEEEEVIPVKSVPKEKMMKTIKGPDGQRFIYDKNDAERIVYKKEDPTVRVGVLTDEGLELDDEEDDDEEDEEEDEEQLSDMDDEDDA